MIKIVSLSVEGNPLAANRKPSFAYRLDGDEALAFLTVSIVGAGLKEPLVLESRNYGGRVPFRGPSLRSREEYRAVLHVEGSSGSTDEKSLSFVTSPKESDFRGGYIGCSLLGNGPLNIRRRLPAFDKENLARAIAYVAGVGMHEVYINGGKVGDALLAPSQSDYRKHVYYEAYDLAPCLNGKGDVFGVILADGWLGSKVMNVLIDLRYKDGKKEEIYSTCNGDWWFASSPIRESSIYGGETIDYRLGQPGDFARQEVEPGFRKGWFSSIYAYGPSGHLLPDPLPPIKAFGRHPLVLLKDEGKRKVYDVGANIAGHVVLRAKGERGSKIVLRHAEAVTEGQDIDQTNLRNAAQEDVYFLSGSGEETLYPHFTFHGFRYVEVTIEGEAEILPSYAVEVHTELKKAGEVEIGEEKLSRLHELAVRTEINNEQGVLSDCPQRDERFGWLNDLTSRIQYLPYDFDASPYCYKVAVDIADTANAKGEIADTAPYFTGGQPADTTTASFLLLADKLIHLYGEKEKAEAVYPSLKAWVEALLARSHDGCMDYYYYADWVRPEGLPSKQAQPEVVSSFFLYWHVALIAKIAAKLGHKKDNSRYSSLLRKLKSLQRKAYLKDGLFGNGSVTETAMALELGLYEEEEREAAYSHMKDLIALDGTHLNCGNQGYRFAFYELCRHGDIDLAFAILRNPEYPGWGYMLANGATSVWERWEKAVLATMNSFDHPMFACYDALFYRFLAGIEITDIEEGKGLFDPAPLEENIPFRVSYKTRKGTIEVSSKGVEDGTRSYEIDVPYGLVLDVPSLGKQLGAGHHELAFHVSK